MTNVKNTKYQVPGSMCPRVRLPGHVVASGRLVHRSSTIDGGDNRSIDTSWFKSRYGGQCLHQLGSRLCLISNAAVLRCCFPRIVLSDKCFRVLSGGDEVPSLPIRLFPSGHNPTCQPVSLIRSNSFNVTGKFYHAHDVYVYFV